jgi:DNA-binding MarR family transcriptional regulator
MDKKLNFEEVSLYEGPKQSPGFLLWHISTSWRGSIEAVLKRLGLTHPQFVVLATTAWLTKSGEFATQAAIGKMAGLDPNTISQIITGLEKKKLIRREASPDGRAKHPKLTTDGSALLAQALPAVEQADNQFFNTLSSKELRTLVQIFQKMTK